jgi:uncharacterized membrane protein
MGATKRRGINMMSGSYGWMGGGMWIWTVTAVVVVALLVLVISRSSRK